MQVRLPPALKGGASNHSTKDSGKSDAKVLKHSNIYFKLRDISLRHF